MFNTLYLCSLAQTITAVIQCGKTNMIGKKTRQARSVCHIMKSHYYNRGHDRFFFICLIESSCFSHMKIEKINSLSIFLPLFWGLQIREISLPVRYKTAHGRSLGIVVCDVNTGLPFSRISLWRSVFLLQRKKTWCSGAAVATRKTR